MSFLERQKWVILSLAILKSYTLSNRPLMKWKGPMRSRVFLAIQSINPLPRVISRSLETNSEPSTYVFVYVMLLLTGLAKSNLSWWKCLNRNTYYVHRVVWTSPSPTYCCGSSRSWWLVETSDGWGWRELGVRRMWVKAWAAIGQRLKPRPRVSWQILGTQSRAFWVRA